MTSAADSHRARLAMLRDRPFDLLVIGGGITGCGIARDAALRGLRVALVEKEDFASGTSSRSSRLVHGGLRYLEHGQVHLVFESSAERRTLSRLAPHLVRPLEFVWPVYAGARIPRWKVAAALTAYDVLALFRNVGRHRLLSRSGVLEREPSLRREGLRGGARYFDAATNDARLTLANAIAAVEAGAVAVNHARVVDLLREPRGGQANGASVQDAITGQRFDVRAAAVVRATGPWAQAVRGSKGVHIAVPRQRVGNVHALTLLAPRDGRVVFVLPAAEQAIVGTTDTYTTASPDDVRPSRDDVQYLLECANAFFPGARLEADDVISAWAGIRPLLPAHGDDPGSASREHAVTTGEDGVIMITGGKLTTYRVMAKDVVDVVVSRLGRRADRRSTARAKREPLPGGDLVSLDDLIAAAARETRDAALGAHLATTFGTRWKRVWEEIGDTDHGEDGARRLAEGLPYTVGELRYSILHEMAMGLDDLLIRRTHLAFETRDHGAAVAEAVAADLAPLFGWNGPEQRDAVDRYARACDRMFGIVAGE